MTVVYLQQSALHYGEDGVIASQVIARARSMERFVGPSEVWFLDAVRTMLSAPGRQAVLAYRRQWPDGVIRRIPFSGRMGREAPAVALAQYGRLRSRTRGRSPLILHCRGEEATLTALAARERGLKARVVCDIRGDALDEHVGRTGDAATLTRVRDRERRAVDGADSVVTPSELLTQVLRERYPEHAPNMSTVPSCVDGPTFSASVRKDRRTAWSLPDDAVVVVYSGKLNAERLPNIMVGLIRELVGQGVDAHLVAISDRVETVDLRAAAVGQGVDPARVRTVTASRDEALAWLSAADVGLLLTPDEPRFRVNASIKIAEYLSAGLVLGLTPWTGSTAARAVERQVGVAIDPDRVAPAARDLVALLADPESSARARAWCTRELTWESVAPVVRRAYGFV